MRQISRAYYSTTFCVITDNHNLNHHIKHVEPMNFLSAVSSLHGTSIYVLAYIHMIDRLSYEVISDGLSLVTMNKLTNYRVDFN